MILACGAPVGMAFELQFFALRMGDEIYAGTEDMLTNFSKHIDKK